MAHSSEAVFHPPCRPCSCPRRLRYQERQTIRTIWPIAVGYYDTTRIIAGWCELRQDFRHFRTDRVLGADFLPERYPGRKLLLRAEWRKRAWTREDSSQRIAAE